MSRVCVAHQRSEAAPVNVRRECRVDDMDSQGNVRAAGRGVQDSGSVLIKLSHRDPNKAVIKKHNSLVLRAESPAEKYSWLVRLKRCVSLLTGCLAWLHSLREVCESTMLSK